jgi:predicted nucleic acid-binding protein
VEQMDFALRKCEVWMCAPVLQEILQGISDDQYYETTKFFLLDLRFIYEDQVKVSLGAASLYRFLRKKGVTIRKANDCIIAWLAIEFNIPLLQYDRDFKIIAEHTPLKLF